MAPKLTQGLSGLPGQGPREDEGGGTQGYGMYGHLRGGEASLSRTSPAAPPPSDTESEPWSCRNLIMSFLGSCSLRSCSTVQARCGTAAAIFPRCLCFTEPARLGSASLRPGAWRGPALSSMGRDHDTTRRDWGASLSDVKLCFEGFFIESG